MKHYIKNIGNLIALSLLLSFSSCTDILEEDPKGQFSTANFFKTQKDFEAAVHALRRMAYIYGQNNVRYNSSFMGEDLQPGRPFCPDGEGDYERFDIRSDNPGAYYEWSPLYNIVKAANFILDNGTTSPLGQTVKDYYLAQAYFWRAYSYFKLVSIYGDVPMITHDVVDYNVKLTPVAAIWEQLILPDIEKAQLAPATWVGTGCAPEALTGNNGKGNVWVSQATAKAAAAYLYLAYAGWPHNHTEYYAKAAEKAKEVIDGVENGTYPFAFMNNYADIYAPYIDLQNTEPLLCHYWGATDGGTFDIPCQEPYDLMRYTPKGALDNCGGWNEFFGEIQFWKDFPAGPRKEATYAPKTLIANDVPKLGEFGEIIGYERGPLLVDWWDARRDEEYRYPWFRKLMGTNVNDAAYYEGPWDYTKGGTAAGGTTPHQIIRLSEVYCWYAEAVGRSGTGDAVKAAALLQKLTNRGDDAPQNYTGLSGEALAEAAYTEHGWEICGDYWGIFAPRYFDELRMDRVKTHFEKRQLQGTNPITLPGGATAKERASTIPQGAWSYDRLIVPIPASEVNMNPNLRK